MLTASFLVVVSVLLVTEVNSSNMWIYNRVLTQVVAMAPLENLCTFQLVAEVIDATQLKVYVSCKDVVTMEGQVSFSE